jgi:outer membrane protein assembly factor BamD
MRMRLSSYFLVFLLCAAGCSLLPEQVDKTKDWSANQLYSAAKESLNDKDYKEAIDYFEKLEARYPFGVYAQQAELEIAYAYYKYDEPDSAIAAAQRFIKTNPRHPNIDYAWYIMGLTNYNRGRTLIDKVLPQDPSQRDTTVMHQAYDDFYQLVKNYPNSKYTPDATQRLIYLRNNMALYEMHVADYYMRRGAYIAAADRSQYVIENYQRTTAVPQALVMSVRAYRKLGMNQLADDALRVLRLNFPDNPAIPDLMQGKDPKKNKGWFSWL